MEHPPLPFVLCNKLGTTVIALFLFMSGYGLAVSFKSKGDAYWKGFFTRRVWGGILPNALANDSFPTDSMCETWIYPFS